MTSRSPTRATTSRGVRCAWSTSVATHPTSRSCSPASSKGLASGSPITLRSRSSATSTPCARHRRSGEAELRTAYRYDTLPDGREIDGRMRRMYVDALHDATSRGDPEPPSPFGVHGVDAFVAWVTEPVAPPVDPQVSRVPQPRARRGRDSPARVPGARRGGRRAVPRLGLRHAGRDDQEIPSWVLPSEDDVIALTKRRWRARPAGSWRRGINIVGYVTAVLGVGHVGRVLTSMLDDAGVPKFVVANRETTSETSVSFDSGVSDRAPFDVNLLCVNADHTKPLAEQVGPDFFAGRRTIGVWFWEVEDFPGSMMPARSSWSTRCGSRATSCSKPSPPCHRSRYASSRCRSSCRHRRRAVTRSALGLPDDRFVFLFVYDFLSTAERKNPIGLIEAYTKAFGPDDGTVLVLKSINGDKRVRRARAGSPGGGGPPRRHRARHVPGTRAARCARWRSATPMSHSTGPRVSVSTWPRRWASASP